ncbi:recombinase family protein [Arthrobacter sp. BF1]|uniref:recombinase family protein n=1 Tax=Arthrobacter sp. BF1 TaxID=2821145 RepID=UPI001C4E562D|nr:recombinase family protein [Arthrobacter sp. BF1]
MTTAAIYARISKDKRKNTEEEGFTVETQIEICREFIKRQGWTVGKIYSDNDTSVYKGTVPRPAFDQMMADGPEVVVYREQSRIERGTGDLDVFIMAGCTGYGTDGSRITVDTASNELMTRLSSIVSRFEVRQKSERQKIRSYEDFKAGKWHFSRKTFGNDWKSGELIPAEADAIREAAKEIAAGRSTFFQTAKIWNAAGFTTPTTSGGFGGRSWEPGTVRNFFLSPRLIGVRKYDEETRKMEGWTPILDEETWDQIQAQIIAAKTGKKGKQGTRRNPHLLTGIAKCGKCGKGLNTGYRGGAENVRFYGCTVRGHLTRRADVLERYVVEKFVYLLIHSGAEQIINPEGHTSSAPLRAQRTKLVMNYDTWMDEATKENLPPSIIGKRVRAHTEQLAALDAQLLEAVKDAVFTDLLPEFLEAGPEALWDKWETVPMTQKREIVGSLYESITVHKAGRSTKFDPKLVTLKATPLMMDLVELNTEPEMIWERLEDIPEELRRNLPIM